MKRKESLNRKTSTAYVIFALLSLILAIGATALYYTNYNGTQYYDRFAAMLPLIGVAAFLVLLLFRPLRPFAGIVLWLCVFGSFLIYIHAVYMYLSEVFYSGITPEALRSISPAFVGTTLLYLCAAIVANVTAWKKRTKEIAVR